MFMDTIEKLNAENVDDGLEAIKEVPTLDVDDRETFGDFDGIKNLCQCAMKFSDNHDILQSFCNAATWICTKSKLNRGIFRSDGGIRIIVNFLAITSREEDITACGNALRAACTMNDGNKKAAAQLKGEFNQEELQETECLDTNVPLFKNATEAGALDLLLDRLEQYPDNRELQEACVWGLRTLACDDDGRQASCAPSAVENRDYLANQDHFPRIRKLVRRHLANDDILHTKLFEGLLLLLKEVGCHQKRIHDLVLEDDVLPTVKAALQTGSENLVKASLFVLRQFAFSDDMKDLLTRQNVHIMTLEAVKRNTANPTIVEQAFGLFSNLTMRKPEIAQTLYEEPCRIVTISQVIFDCHKERPNVLRAVIQTLRNVSKQVPEAATDVIEYEIFDIVRKIVLNHQDHVANRENSKDIIDLAQKLDTQDGSKKLWQVCVDVSKQFLREFREDVGEGLVSKIRYNEFY